MLLIRELLSYRQACDEARSRGLRVGLVPTMGALHKGHTTLIEEARKHADFVVVSIFVNPTQFGPNEDFSRYPRTLERDMAQCERAGASLVFSPDTAAMYPPGEQTRVRVGELAAPLCGAHREGHFEGVATIVTKLLCLTGPAIAAFGRKDYQQLQVIKRIVTDLFLPITVLPVRTVREPDGLALSSRNAYLSAEARESALAIPRGLSRAARAFAAGERSRGALWSAVHDELLAAADSIDYVELADPDTLRVLTDDTRVGERALLALAIRIRGTRLIDNIVLGEEPPPIAQG